MENKENEHLFFPEFRGR